jgi:hypothetical protein
MSLSEIVHFVFSGVDATCGHRVQQRLPEMTSCTLHESDCRAPSEAMAETGDEFEPGGSAADDYNAVCLLVRVRCRALLICAPRIMNTLAVH